MRAIHRIRLVAGLGLGLGLITQCGCAVPQKPGRGTVTRQTEPLHRSGYWLYLPEDYVKTNGQRPDGKRWPLMVTFHGMNPYDSAGAQIRECQQEADRYGYVVIAPELDTCDSFMQYPLRDPNLPYVKRDERAVLGIMDEVFRRTNADPTRVLATSWSCGGYMAHFMVNRYPERFTTLAVRQSNFCENLLDIAQLPKYRNMRIAIFFGENDFNACRKESIRAVEWYRSHGFYVEAKEVSGLGHERTPQTAAAFFAAAIGAVPKTPPDLGTLVMKDVMPAGRTYHVAGAAGRYSSPAVSAAPPPTGPNPYTDRNIMFNSDGSGNRAANPTQVQPAEPIRRAPPTVRTESVGAPTPKRPVRQPYGQFDRAGMAPIGAGFLEEGADLPLETSPPASPELPAAPPFPAEILIHGSTANPAPLWVTMSVNLPESARTGARVHWSVDGEPLKGNSLLVQSLLRQAGQHRIEAFVTTADNQAFALSRTVTVTAPASQPAES